MSENWKPIPGWEGFYEASDLGQIRRCARHARLGYRPVFLKASVLKQGVDDENRAVVTLSREGKHTYHRVARLVAAAFFGLAPEGKPQVAHLDGDPSNSRLSNLKYVDQKENEAHKLIHGRRPLGERHWLARHTHAQVLEARRLRALGWKYIDIAEKLGFTSKKSVRYAVKVGWKHLDQPGAGA